MKKILSALIAVLLPLTANAQVTRQQAEDQLIGLGMPGLQANLVAQLGTGNGVVSNNTWQTARNAAGTANINVWEVDSSDNTVLNSSASDVLILQLEDDANRLINFSAGSDAALSATWGDGGATATQILTVSASTADADDDSTLILCGGGGTAGTRGACITLPGEEVSGGGDITINTGTGDFVLFSSAGTAVAAISSTLGLSFQQSGTTIEIQEATAGAACSGTLTANGGTPVVVSTTCATTGSRIFTQRTSAETGTVNGWISAISNGVSFSFTSEAADTGTYNWFIIHEAA